MSLDRGSKVGTLDKNKVAYAELFVTENAVATVITVTNTPHSVTVFGAGHTQEYTIVAGISGTTSAFADYGGTVAGTVKATDGTHGLTTGDIITIEGGTNYLGVFEVTVIDGDNFYFTDTWVADDGAVAWSMGDYIKINRKDDISINSGFSCTPSTNNDIFKFVVYVNTTPITHFTSEVKLKLTTDLQTTHIGGVDPVSENDRIWMAITNVGGTGNITIKHGNLTINSL